MKRRVTYILLFALLFAFKPLCGIWAQSGKKSNLSPQEYIDQVLKKNKHYKDAVVAIYAVDGQGKAVARWNSNLPLLTASTLKTVTTGLALVYLGEDFKYETTLSYRGSISDGILYGNLYIIGGADPTLGSEDEVAYKTDEVFGSWAEALKSLGISRIEGNIVVDDSYLCREVIPSSWTWGNIGYNYGSAPSGLPFHEDVQNVIIYPGKNVGDSASVKVLYPQIPNFKYLNTITTEKAKSGDESEYFTSDLARVGKFAGSVPVDKDSIKTTISNKFAYLSCGVAFRDFLISNGVAIGPDILTLDEALAEASAVSEISLQELQSSLTPITTTYSPELWKIVEVTNRVSNNFFAETIYKTLGKKMFGEGTYSAAKKAARKLLDSLGVSRTGYSQDDGSGLSRQNYLSPEFFCRFYSMMEKQPVFERFYESLPYSGVGTLKYVMRGKEFDSKIAERVHAKSGSLSSVKCYAGYAEAGPKHGTIKFAILVNNYSGPTREIQKGLEGFMYSLANAD